MYRAQRLHLALMVTTILVVSGFSTLSSVMASEDSIVLKPDWKKGDRFLYELAKTRKQTRPGEPSIKTTANMDIHVGVLDATDSGFEISWTQGEAKFSDNEQAKNPFVQKISNLLKGHRIVLAIDVDGNLVGVKNWEAIQEKSTKIVNACIGEMREAGIDQELRYKTFSMLSSMFNSKEQIETFCTRDVKLFFAVLGIEFDGSNPIEYEATLPNPFGGEPIPCQGRFTLTELDKDSGQALISWTQTVDPDECTRIIAKTFDELSLKPVPEDSVDSIIVGDSAEFVVDVASGWVLKMSHKRSIQVGEAVREDIFSLKRKLE